MKAKIHSISEFRKRLTTSVPLYLSSVKAGFPSPADDYIENALDFNEYIVKHPAATFTVRVAGESMIGAGIHDGDLLVVDRSLTPRNGSVIIAVLAGELTVKRLMRQGERTFLKAENPLFKQIEISPEDSFETWGVVTNVIHSLV